MKSARARRPLRAAVVLVACAAAGCGESRVEPTTRSPDGDPVGVTETAKCFSAEQSFAWELYGPVFSRCIGCHNEFGLAAKYGLGLRLSFPGQSDFLARNVALLADYARRSVDTAQGELPLLLAKPTGRVGHVGGEVVSASSAEGQLLASFVDKLRNPPTCGERPQDDAAAALAGLTLASPRETVARATFVLTGQVPLPEELDGLPDTEEALDRKLDEIMTSEATREWFLERVGEMFADWLLTDAYSSLVRGDDLLQQLRDFPQRDYFRPLCTPERDFGCCDPAQETCCAAVAGDPTQCSEAANDLAIDAVAREPLELVKHTVRNDLPVTELLTANYALVNPYSAIIYGLSDGQRAALFDTDPSNDPGEWKAVQITPTPQNALRQGPGGAYPHAGILSMPSLLVRYPSSASNQQRTRAARLVLERFLAIPVMKLADFSTASLPAEADLELATQEYPACTVCHAAIDPIAGNFRNFGSSGQYRPTERIPSHLPKPAFLGQKQIEGEDPVRWLGLEVARHERFALAVVMPVLADLVGGEILSPPTDVLAKDYRAKYLAFRIQQLELERLRGLFAGPFGLRLRPLIKAIIQGPLFRAAASGQMDDRTAEALALAGVGRGTLLTPEQLARKLESITGLTYRSNLSPTGRDLFRSFRDYRLMFGGTDWDATPNRYREPNAMAVRIALRMGNEMACLAVPQDFSLRDPGRRRLFRHVGPTTTEAAGESLVRAEIRRLHRLVLNEDLGPDDPEIEATFQLWAQSRAALSGRRGQGARLPGRCRATESFTSAEVAYPDAEHEVIDQDPEGVVRAWMAVFAYLLADGRFFLQ